MKYVKLKYLGGGGGKILSSGYYSLRKVQNTIPMAQRLELTKSKKLCVCRHLVDPQSLKNTILQES